MDNSLRLLQFSDLLFCANPQSEGNENLASEFESVALRFEPKKIDYIVVCGNVTRDGSPKAFVRAGKWLVDLANRILGPRHGRDLANRVMVAPGPLDLPTRLTDKDDPLKNFNVFLLGKIRRGLGNDLKTQPALTTTSPLVYQLKDATFIVAPYWHRVDIEANIEPLLTEAVTKIVDYPYRRATPTFLISSASPLLAPAKRLGLTETGRATAEARLRVNFHLFGSSPVFVVPFDPFVFRHLGLATGPRRELDFWPFRANLMEITALEVGDPKNTQTRNICLHRLYSIELHALENASGHWVAESWCEGKQLTLHRHFKSSYSVADAHSSLRSELARWLNDNAGGSVRRLDHVPGSGVSECLEEFARNPGALGDWNVIVEHIPKVEPVYDATQNADHRAWEELIRKLKDLVKQRDANECRTLLVLDDPTYIWQETTESPDWIDELWRDIQKQFQYANLRILYLVTPRVARNEFSFRFRELKINPVDRESSLSITSSFQYDFPFQPEAVEHLTGGALRLKGDLLDQGRLEFNNWPGGAQVTPETVTELLHHAGRTQSKAFMETREVVSRMDRGPAFLSNVSEALRLASDPSQAPIPVPREHEDLAALLFSQGLLDRSNGSYTVRALGPFLDTYTSCPLGAAELEKPGPRRKVAEISDLLICYAKQDLDLVKLFRRVLSPLETRLRLRVWVDTQLVDGLITPGIQHQLKTCRMALFFVSSHSIETGRYMIKYEVPVLKKRVEDGEQLTLLNVFCDTCLWEQTDLADVPKGAGTLRPLRDLEPQDRQKEFAKLCDKIKEQLEVFPSEGGADDDM